jgi:hypothetical protein
MVPLSALWLPILVSAIFVFVWSSLVHMVFGYHRSDYSKLPNEDAALDALRGAAPGTYPFPYCPDPKDMASPAMQEKYKRGPIGILNVMPNGMPAMGPLLGQWFAFSVLVAVFAAYLTGRAFGPGTPYLTVFRFAGTITFLAYASTRLTDPIWKGEKWSIALKHVFDGLVYALLSAGAFGWLWPRA